MDEYIEPFTRDDLIGKGWIIEDSGYFPDPLVQPVKEVTVTRNEVMTVQPNSGYKGMSEVSLVVNVPAPEPLLQSKVVDVIENGVIEVMPDETYEGLSSVKVNVNVPNEGTPVNASQIGISAPFSLEIGDVFYENYITDEHETVLDATEYPRPSDIFRPTAGIGLLPDGSTVFVTTRTTSPFIQIGRVSDQGAWEQIPIMSQISGSPRWYDMDVSFDGLLILAQSSDNMYIFEYNNGSYMPVTWTGPSVSNASSARFSIDKRILVYTYSSLYIYERQGSNFAFSKSVNLTTRKAQILRESPDGRFLVSGGTMIQGMAALQILRYDNGSYVDLNIDVPELITYNGLKGAAWSPDSKTLILSTTGATATVCMSYFYNIIDDNLTLVSTRGDLDLMNPVFYKDGSTVIGNSASSPSNISLYDADTFTRLRSFNMPNYTGGAYMSPKNDFVVYLRYGTIIFTVVRIGVGSGTRYSLVPSNYTKNVLIAMNDASINEDLIAYEIPATLYEDS